MRRALLLIGAAPAVFAALHAQAPLATWTLSAQPTLVLAEDGSPEKEFHQIGGAWRRADGGIVVANVGSNELRAFDARGTFQRSFGRKGRGPGEFEVMRLVVHSGDTVFVYDGALRRTTIVLFDASPRVLGEWRLPESDGPQLDITGRLRDGRWVVRGGMPPDLAPPLGRRRVVSKVGLFGAVPTGQPRWLLESPDFAVLVDAPDPAQPRVALYPAPFMTRLEIEAGADAIWLGDTGADSVVRVDPATGARRAMRLPDPAPELTDALVEAAKAREMRTARSEPQREGIERKFRATNLPARHPAFSDIVAGADGEAWVRRRLPTVAPDGEAAAPGAYVVVSASGRALARVTVPPGFRILDVGRDYVVGVQPDADGVESVLMFGLRR